MRLATLRRSLLPVHKVEANSYEKAGRNRPWAAESSISICAKRSRWKWVSGYRGASSCENLQRRMRIVILEVIQKSLLLRFAANALAD
jgi:hypothetical protein